MSAQAFQQFSDDGGELLYSFPGPRSYPILVGRFGFQRVKQLRHCVYPLTINTDPTRWAWRAALAAYKRVFRSRCKVTISEALEGLPYADRSLSKKAIFSRCKNQQKWRFQSMGRQYHQVRVPGIDGFIVVGRQRRRARYACTIVDLEADDAYSIGRLLGAVPPWAEEQGCDVVYTWLRNPVHSFLMAGFLPLPSTTKFIVKAAPTFRFPELLQRGDLWDLSLLDTDAY